MPDVRAAGTADPVVTVGVASIVVVLVLSAFFSSSEITVFSLSPEWLVDEGRGVTDERARATVRRVGGAVGLVVAVLPDGGERYLSTDLFEGDASEP